jgi:ATP-dependent RNA helicase A
LDVVIGLIGIGHYPNICVHREKRKVQMADARSGPSLIHKSSVNCPDSDEIEFPLPYFVFSEKIRAGAVVCKNVTLVTPIHLILFGSKRIQMIPEASGMDIIRLDGWINFQINPQTVANILSLKPALDETIARLSADPESIIDYFRSPVVKLIMRLCDFHAAEYPSSPACQVLSWSFFQKLFLSIYFSFFNRIPNVLQTKDLIASSNLVATKLVLYLIGLHLSVKTFRQGETNR